MKKLIFILMLGLALVGTASAQKGAVKKVKKKYEKFDFGSMDITGDSSSPGDLSVDDRVKSKFKNRIPEKPNFVPEMKASVDSVL